MKLVKIILFLLLFAIAACWLIFRSNDPLAESKKAERSAVSDPEAEQRIAEALDAIGKNDMKKLSGMMQNGDPMYFDDMYANGIFAKNDFCPANLRAVYEVSRSEKTWWQAEVFSEPRGKTYVFTLEKDKKGVLRISSVEEAKGGKK